MTEGNVKFSLGQMVFSRVDPDSRGMITAITFRPGCVIYGVTWEDLQEQSHYEIELSAEQTFDQAKP